MLNTSNRVSDILGDNQIKKTFKDLFVLRVWIYDGIGWVSPDWYVVL